MLPLLVLPVLLAAPVPETKAPAEALRAKLRAAAETYKLSFSIVKAGRRDALPEDVYRWSRRWMEAAQELGEGKAAAEAHLERMRELKRLVKALLEGGLATALEAAAADYYVAEAEGWVAQRK
jgi:hypothetical protein